MKLVFYIGFLTLASINSLKAAEPIFTRPVIINGEGNNQEKDDIGYWLFRGDLEANHQIQNYPPNKIKCHIRTVSYKKRSLCSDKNPAYQTSYLAASSFSFEDDARVCRGVHPLAGLPFDFSFEDNGLDHLFLLTDIMDNYTPIRETFADQVSRSPLQDITRGIIQVANVFQIDAALFTSLLAHESGFCKTARSQTGARGLGQITRSAWREVKDQLDGNNLNRPTASRAGQEYIRKKAQELGFTLNEIRNTKLEDLIEEKNWKLNLFFSGAYLKILMAKQSRRLRNKDLSGFSQGSRLEQALRGYNAAGGNEEATHYSEVMCQMGRVYYPGDVREEQLPRTPVNCRNLVKIDHCRARKRASFEFY